MIIQLHNDQYAGAFLPIELRLMICSLDKLEGHCFLEASVRPNINLLDPASCPFVADLITASRNFNDPRHEPELQ